MKISIANEVEIGNSFSFVLLSQPRTQEFAERYEIEAAGCPRKVSCEESS